MKKYIYSINCIKDIYFLTTYHLCSSYNYASIFLSFIHKDCVTKKSLGATNKRECAMCLSEIGLISLIDF